MEDKNKKVKKVKNDKKKEEKKAPKRLEKASIYQRIRIPLLILLSIIIVFCLVKITIWVIENNRTNSVSSIADEAVEEIENNTEYDKKYKVDFEKLKEINEDVVAWVKVENTNIKYAVVKGNDREYYLTHSLDSSYNTAGWIFMDPDNKLDGTDKNIVIYGHNRKDLSMFGTLSDVLEESYLDIEENKKVTFVTENGYYIGHIFSIYTVPDEGYYITTSFTDESFESFIDRLKGRSEKDLNVEVNKEDTILTLSTCADNNKYRVVVHAKLEKVE